MRQSVHEVAKDEYELTLLHINDHHSHLDETTVPLMLDAGGAKRERVLVAAGGFPRVVSAMKTLEARATGSVIKVHAGDAITGDLYYSLTKGQADADLMNTVCFDTFTLGNHEFDHGDAALKDFIDRLHGGECRTHVLSANVRFGADSALHPSKAPGYVQPSAIIERDGRRIGLVGITVADKTKNASRPDPGTNFLDEAASAQAQIDALANQGVDIIVLQTHYGYRNDLALAGRLRGVDAIIGGDSHTLLGPASLQDYGLAPIGPYPTHATDLDGNPVCVAQAGHYAYVVGELRLRLDDKGRLLSCEGRPHLLIGDDFRRAKNGVAPLSPAEIHTVMADVARSNALRITPPDADATAALAPYQAQKSEFGSTVVAQVAHTLCARRVPGAAGRNSASSQGTDCSGNDRLARHGGDVQQLVAQAFLEQARQYFDADVALINAGGVRIDLRPGPLTVKDIHTLLPFKNTLVQLKVPGSVLKAALESAIEAALGPGRSTGAFPYAAGMRWQLDAASPQNNRLTRLETLDAGNGHVQFDPDRVYSVATIDFIADGKDHYTPFAQLDEDQRVDVGLDATALFLDYVRAIAGPGGFLQPLPASRYSTQKIIDGP
ncbi:bifunctional metallophosphatase/5'-nucleotidase [Pusillimonas sp.]|uniref:bifunctional metallophosphatase/5'-nucleotidase n=1 Tax=Pusillimonas sp. TaxID=3040095 RepID=UPI0037C70418